MNGHIAIKLLVAGCWLLLGFQFSAGAGFPWLTQTCLIWQPRCDGKLSVDAEKPAPTTARTEIFAGQGFDTCEIPSVSALQTWFTTSPYRAVNLYIGGSGRYCSNRALNAERVARLGEIGWKFIPTWVGLQAPCYTGNKPRMSDDPATAHAQGIAEASAALKTAIDLGLALPDDMEAYASQDPVCDAPVRAFISGWTGELHARGNLAGVYGNAHALTGFAAIANVPDAVWPARWLYTAYNPTVTVWDVPNLAPTLWAEHQRIWQYAGGHNEAWNMVTPDIWNHTANQNLESSHSETWGGVTLNIDCDVIDGIVAVVTPPVLAQKVYLPAIMHEPAAP
jgi:hypothetical protein